jgi:hypothetical protein
MILENKGRAFEISYDSKAFEIPVGKFEVAAELGQHILAATKGWSGVEIEALPTNSGVTPVEEETVVKEESVVEEEPAVEREPQKKDNKKNGIKMNSKVVINLFVLLSSSPCLVIVPHSKSRFVR